VGTDHEQVVDYGMCHFDWVIGLHNLPPELERFRGPQHLQQRHRYSYLDRYHGDPSCIHSAQCVHQ
jgi:hypothetical protein